VTTLYFASPIRSSRSANRWTCEPDDQVKGTTARRLARMLPSVIGSIALAGVPKFRKRGPLIGHYDVPNTLSAPPQRGRCALGLTTSCIIVGQVMASRVRNPLATPNVIIPRIGCDTFSGGRWSADARDIRTSLCSCERIPPGKSFARPETAAAFLATAAEFGRQRPHSPASPAAKPRKVKDYSDRGGKPESRKTAGWGWQDSNWQPSDYGTRCAVSGLRRQSHGKLKAIPNAPGNENCAGPATK
jgi:hypothetical protein